MDKKLITNFFYNTGYQILVLLLPFITIPYVSRVLTPYDLGIYGSSYATVQLFLIIGLFGIGSFGTREIANVKDNKEALTIKFFQLRNLQKKTMIISMIIYLLIIYLLYDNQYVYLFQGIYLLSGIVDISWFFMGIEDFKKTVVRNLFVKITSLIFIFIFIKDSKDLYLYILILAGSTLIGNLTMWIYLKNLILEIKPTDYKLKYYFISAVSLLIPQLCFQLYTSFDRTVLGFVSTMNEVGIYDQSQKIIRMSVAVVTSLGVVMLPRITSLVGKKEDLNKINDILHKSLNITLFISVAASFGIYSISENFVPWFFGVEYYDIIMLLKLSSLICLFSAIGSFLSNQIAIPINNKKAYMIPLIVGAVVSIIMNLFLGYYFGAIGACITILLTEVIAVTLRIYYLRKCINLIYIFKDLFTFLFSGIFMLCGIKFLDFLFPLNPGIMSTIFEFFVGGILYLTTILVLKKSWRDMLIIRLKKVLF